MPLPLTPEQAAVAAEPEALGRTRYRELEPVLVGQVRCVAGVWQIELIVIRQSVGRKILKIIEDERLQLEAQNEQRRLADPELAPVVAAAAKPEWDGELF